MGNVLVRQNLAVAVAAVHGPSIRRGVHAERAGLLLPFYLQGSAVDMQFGTALNLFRVFCSKPGEPGTGELAHPS